MTRFSTSLLLQLASAVLAVNLKTELVSRPICLQPLAERCNGTCIALRCGPCGVFLAVTANVCSALWYDLLRGVALRNFHATFMVNAKSMRCVASLPVAGKWKSVFKVVCQCKYSSQK